MNLQPPDIETLSYLSLPLVEGLAAFEDERDPVPPLVADVEHGGGEGGAGGALRHGLVVQVAEPGVRILAVGVPDVLAQHALGQGQGGDGLEHLHLLVPVKNMFCSENRKP